MNSRQNAWKFLLSCCFSFSFYVFLSTLTFNSFALVFWQNKKSQKKNNNNLMWVASNVIQALKFTLADEIQRFTTMNCEQKWFHNSKLRCQQIDDVLVALCLSRSLARSFIRWLTDWLPLSIPSISIYPSLCCSHLGRFRNIEYLPPLSI